MEDPKEIVTSEATPDEGQVAEEQVSEDGGQVEQTEEEPYFSYEHEDGEKFAFKSADELRDYFRGNLLRRADYTRKTQTVAQIKKELENQRKKYDLEYQTVLEKKNLYDQYDKKLKGLTPEQLDKVIAQVRGTVQTLPPEIQEIRQQLEEQKKAQEAYLQQQKDMEAREQAYGYLEKTIPGFDRKKVQSEIDKLQNIDPGDEMRIFAELVHYAMLGRQAPSQIEDKVTENLRRKNEIPNLMGGGSVKPLPKMPSNLDEAADMAKKEYG